MNYNFTPCQKRFLKTILLVLISLWHLQAQAQTRYYVDSTSGNDANIGTSWTSAFRNVTKAVAAANSSTSPVVEIWISHGTYHPIDGIASLPADIRDTSFTFYRGNGIGKALKIYGGFMGSETSIADRDTSHHTYLDAALGGSLYSYHVFVVAGLAPGADSVVIDGLSIRYGRANYATASKVYNGVVITTDGGGGNITNDSSASFVIQNCRFLTNSGINGGNLMNNNTLASIINCYFYNGFCGSGGGIYNSSSSALITGCTFASNTAAGWGGGMYNQTCSPTITNCHFIDNWVKLGPADYAYGGAIYNNFSSAHISDCSFTANYAYGDGYVCGAAIYNHGTSTPTIDSCNFTANHALVLSSGNAYGGAIFNESCTPQITNSTFLRNRASSYGDAFEGPGYSYGGGIYNVGSTTTVASCSFNANVAISYEYDYEAYAYGGAMYSSSTSLTVTNTTFTSDSARAFGILSQSYAGGMFNTSSASSISNCSFTGETSIADFHAYGGAVHNTDFSDMVANNCKFTNNFSTENGGGIFFYYCKLRAVNCLFKGNVSGCGGAIGIGGYGPYASSFTGFSNIFERNIATSDGGGAIRPYLNGGTDTLINNVFAGNNDLSTSGGGAIYILGSTHHYANNTFFADTSAAPGGAIQIYNAVLALRNNLFYANYGLSSMPDTNSTGTVTISSTNNLWSTTNPLFINSSNPIGTDGIWGTIDDGLELQRCSPARNTGSNTYVISGETTDVAGSPRIEGAGVDIGAYESNPVGLISGAYNICIGLTETLSDTTTGGTWVSQDPAVATINSAGVATGMAIGTARILYIVTSTCGTDTARTTVTVIPAAYAGTIYGPSNVCISATITLTDSVTGGTWSVTNTHAAITGGVVTGVTAGADTVIYTNSCGLGTTTYVVTVNASPSAGTISGASTVCVGATVTLTDPVSGGTWTASNAFATASGGIITGATAGVDTISYAVTNTCGTAIATKTVTVNPLPSAGTITGPSSVCIGATITLTDGVAGGTWSNTTSTATVAGGIVTGISPGIDTIRYTVTNSCGTAIAKQPVTINPLPAAGTISGASSLCTGTATTLSDPAAGGTWSSNNSTATVTAGVVSGSSPGVDTIQYTVTNGCGTATATHTITIYPSPSAITAPDTICVGRSVTLSDTPAGGTWTSASPAIATITATTGILHAVTIGSASITYAVPNGCLASKTVSVTFCPAEIATINTGQAEVYPNPATDELQIVSVQNITDILITDVVGNKVFLRNYNSHKVQVNIQDLSPGVYYIRINGTDIRKLVKL